MKFLEAIDEIVLRIGGEAGVKYIAWHLFFVILGTVVNVLFPIPIPPILRIVYTVVLVGIYLLLLLAERGDLD